MLTFLGSIVLSLYTKKILVREVQAQTLHGVSLPITPHSAHLVSVILMVSFELLAKSRVKLLSCKQLTKMEVVFLRITNHEEKADEVSKGCVVAIH